MNIFVETIVISPRFLNLSVGINEKDGYMKNLLTFTYKGCKLYKN